MTVFPRLIKAMQDRGIWDDVALLGGGVIPDDDVAELKRMGVAEILGQDSTPDAVVSAFRRAVRTQRAKL
jgi:methylmalonyl-CoA mutase C-terminal domain/subunit